MQTTAFLIILALVAPLQRIETQYPDRGKVIRLETAMDHLTVIELAEPVTLAAAGSSLFKIERRDNKVFIQPLEEGASTNLFVWTGSGRCEAQLRPHAAAGPADCGLWRAMGRGKPSPWDGSVDMSVLFVFAASDLEAEPIRKIGKRGEIESILRCGENDVVLLSGAMGPKNARRTAEAAFRLTTIRQPHVVLVVGLCGGLVPSLGEGSIVTYAASLSTDAGSGRLSCSPAVLDSITGLLAASNVACQRVTGITSSRIATNREQRAALAKNGADVVDMESYPIIEAASAAGVPAAVLRVVSDSVDRSLPDLNRALDESGGLDNRKALAVALRSPVAVFRLLTANRRAMQRLAGPLEMVLKASCFG